MNDDVPVTDYDKPLSQNVERLQNCLAGLASVVGVQHRLSEMFVTLFLEHYVDLPASSVEAPNWSNWTHHTYYAIRSTAKLLGLVCTFETMGRMDAVIETGDEYPGVILVAEWETNGLSVFGEHRELEKLWVAANAQPRSDAFLFTYCPVESLYDVTRRVTEFWQNRESSRQTAPSLYLTTVAHRKTKQSHEFVFIRTMEIQQHLVRLWHDLAFVDTKDYLACIERL